MATPDGVPVTSIIRTVGTRLIGTKATPSSRSSRVAVSSAQRVYWLFARASGPATTNRPEALVVTTLAGTLLVDSTGRSPPRLVCPRRTGNAIKPASATVLFISGTFFQGVTIRTRRSLTESQRHRGLAQGDIRQVFNHQAFGHDITEDTGKVGSHRCGGRPDQR